MFDELSEGQKTSLRSLAQMMMKNRADRKKTLASHLIIGDLMRAPLWVGALEDVNAILPVGIGMFDYVVFDEASHVSQPGAAGALARAKRAIVCGDPQQLGHKSETSDEQVREATERFGTDPDILNVGQRSLLDIASAKVPAQVLDEHFRSAPHLIEFSNCLLYTSPSPRDQRGSRMPSSA